LAKNTFLKDWCFVNPKKPEDKDELCDLLVVFDSTLIIFQVKNTKPDQRKEPTLFKDRDINKNLKQLDGAYRRLFDKDLERILLENMHGIKSAFDPCSIKQTILVSILCCEEEVDSFPAILHTERGRFVHCLNREFTKILLEEIDTIYDLIQYLTTKEEFIVNHVNSLVSTGEEELLAYYLFNERSFDKLKADGKATIFMEYGSWEEIKKRPEYIRKKEADEISYFWDSLIEFIHTANDPQYEIIAREMAKLPRVYRRQISKMYLDKYYEVQSNPTPVARRYFTVNDFNTTYVFVFFAGEDAEARRKDLLISCVYARGRYRDNTKVVGIARSIAEDSGHDFFLYELPIWNEEQELAYKKLENSRGVITTRSGTHQEFEYPE
jgi:hypothetical protein